MDIKKYLRRARTSITKLPDHKQYVELITATLTIPVLATAVVLNVNNLKPKTATPAATPSTVQEKIIYVSPGDTKDSTNNTTTATVPTATQCTKDIAPLTITSPAENDTITDNPVNITIDYDQGNYCSAVWSYRINGGQWSDYDDRSIALYNLPKGIIHFDLRVKSLAAAVERNYSRTFTYAGSNDQLVPTATTAPVSSSSASM